MGLDQWLYKVEKLSPEECAEVDKMSLDELKNSIYAYVCVRDDDAGVLDSMEDIMSLCHEVFKWREEIDMKKVCKAFGYPDTARLAGCSISNGVCTYTVSNVVDKQYRTLGHVTDVEIKEKKCYTKHKRKFIVFKEKELKYWRKEYDLQDEMYHAYEGHMDNCKYCEMNDIMRKAVLAWQKANKWDGNKLTEEEMTSGEGYKVCYYEWY